MKNQRKWVSLVLALAMALGIIGVLPAAEVAAEDETLSIDITTVNFGESPEGTEVQQRWLDILEEQMGVKLDLNYNFISPGDYATKVQIMINGAEIPDLMTHGWLGASKLNEAGALGLFEEIGQHLDELPNYKKVVEADPYAKATVYDGDGNLWAFFNGQYAPDGSADMSAAMAVRGDIFEELGLEYPQTLDELYDAAMAIKESGKMEYPIILHEEWQEPENVVYSAYHVSPAMFYDGEKYVYGPRLEEYRDALQWMNKIYEAGLISPDYFTQTSDNGAAAVANGDVAIIPSVWNGYPAVWSQDYPDQHWTLLKNVDKDADTEAWAFSPGIQGEWNLNGSYSVVVNPNAEHKDQLLQFMDLQYSPEIVDLMTWGIKDVTYTEDENGDRQIMEEVIENPDILRDLGHPTGGSCRAGIFPQVENMTLKDRDFKPNSPIYDWEKDEVVEEKVFDFSASHITDENSRPQAPRFVLSSDENEEYSTIVSVLDTFVAEQRAAFIRGDRSFDEWDSYVEELYGMGDIDRIEEIYNTRLEDALSKISE